MSENQVKKSLSCVTSPHLTRLGEGALQSQTHGCRHSRSCGRGHRQNSYHYNNHFSNPFKRKDPFPRQKRNNGDICLA